MRRVETSKRIRGGTSDAPTGSSSRSPFFAFAQNPTVGFPRPRPTSLCSSTHSGGVSLANEPA
jgi:hypothetical protein